MDKILVVVFDNEKKASDGCNALRALHTEGSITLFAMAVIAKDTSGMVAVKQAANQGPLGTAVGLVTGSLIGLLGGPVGVAIGAEVGMVGGMLSDLWTLGVGDDLLGEVGKHLTAGKTAVVAEVWEEWVTPVDTRMEAAGGIVFRRTLGEVRDALIERESDAFEAEIGHLKAEYDRATGDAKAKLQAKIDAVKAKLHATQDRARTAFEAAKQETDAKIKSVQEQAAKAKGEAKADIDARIVKVRSAYKRRTDKLSEAWELTKQALAV
jgi:uncharacterized membrane protein